MGLFDGVPESGADGGTTADLAARFGLPVLLVLDVAGQSQSAAVVARGFASHDPAVRIAGVVLNRVGSERHRALVADAIAAADIPILGAVPRDAALALPERHLGLVQAAEHADLALRLDALADMAERHLDLDRILAIARPPSLPAPAPMSSLPPPGQRIALAADAAFSFVYPHVVWLAARRRRDRDLLAARRRAAAWALRRLLAPRRLSGASRRRARGGAPFRAGLTRFAPMRPVHGECGGYMVLGEGLEDADGVRHLMTGLLGHATSFARRKLHLGYRVARLLADSAMGAPAP